MIQLSNLTELEEKDISKLDTIITPELQKRASLYERYKRKQNDSELISSDGKTTKITFEKYIVDIASGYLSGKAPNYAVTNVVNKERKNVIQKMLSKIVGEKDYINEMEVLIDFITKYNDDGNEHYQLVKDVLITSGAYEIIYENNNNEIVYSRLDPLQTVAIWDYNVPKNIVGLVRKWQEQDVNSKTYNKIQIIDKNGTRTYENSTGNYKVVLNENGEEIENNNWKDVPAIVIEQEDGLSIFEPVIDLINAYQQLIQNTRNLFQYNDEAKLKVTGFTPGGIPATIEETYQDEKGITKVREVENPARKVFDEALLKAKVFYTPDASGDIAWIEKNINDGAIQNTLKTYIDLIMMNTGVPNITDLGFTKADNASAIDRKFFTLEQMTIDIMKKVKMAYLRRWELIFDRINLEKKTNYDFRDVEIDLPKNLPANENEIIDMWLKLRGLVSDETIVEKLPLELDWANETNRIDEQSAESLNREIARYQAYSGNSQEEQEDLEENENIEE